MVFFSFIFCANRTVSYGTVYIICKLKYIPRKNRTHILRWLWNDLHCNKLTICRLTFTARDEYCGRCTRQGISYTRYYDTIIYSNFQFPTLCVRPLAQNNIYIYININVIKKTTHSWLKQHRIICMGWFHYWEIIILCL